jgi:DNA-binding beta-propeller fold protein YncE
VFVADTGNHAVRLVLGGWVSTLAGGGGAGAFADGPGALAALNGPRHLAIDGSSGLVYIADSDNNAVRTVTRAGALVSTLAGNGEAGFVDGQGPNARSNGPHSVVVAANGDFIVSDQDNHSIRVLSPDGAVRTLVGNGEAGFADGQGADARLSYPSGLAMDPEGNVLVADFGNHSVRKVTMAGAVSTGK